LEEKAAEHEDTVVGRESAGTVSWYLYMVRTRQNALYTGITTDVERRLQEHRACPVRGARYLRGKGPLELVFSACAGTRGEALRLEYRVKQLPRSQKDALVAGTLSLEGCRSCCGAG